MLIFNTRKAAVFETKFFLEEVNTTKFLLLLQNILGWKKRDFSNGYQTDSHNNYGKFCLPQNLAYPKTQSRHYSTCCETKAPKSSCILNAMD